MWFGLSLLYRSSEPLDAQGRRLDCLFLVALQRTKNQGPDTKSKQSDLLVTMTRPSTYML